MKWLVKKYKTKERPTFGSLIFIWGVIGISLSIISCSDKEETLFESIPKEQSGIDFSNTLHSTPNLNILNYIYFYNGAGVASADFNNDGLLDLYFVANQNQDHLYLNQGTFKFLPL